MHVRASRALLALVGQVIIKKFDQYLIRKKSDRDAKIREYCKFMDSAPKNDFFRDALKINLLIKTVATDSECGVCDVLERDFFERHIENMQSLESVVSEIYGISIVGDSDIRSHCENLIGAIFNISEPIENYSKNIAFGYTAPPPDFVPLSEENQHRVYAIRSICNDLFRCVGNHLSGTQARDGYLT